MAKVLHVFYGNRIRGNTVTDEILFDSMYMKHIYPYAVMVKKYSDKESDNAVYGGVDWVGYYNLRNSYNDEPIYEISFGEGMKFRNRVLEHITFKRSVVLQMIYRGSQKE